MRICFFFSFFFLRQSFRAEFDLFLFFRDFWFFPALVFSSHFLVGFYAFRPGSWYLRRVFNAPLFLGSRFFPLRGFCPFVVCEASFCGECFLCLDPSSFSSGSGFSLSANWEADESLFTYFGFFPWDNHCCCPVTVIRWFLRFPPICVFLSFFLENTLSFAVNCFFLPSPFLSWRVPTTPPPFTPFSSFTQRVSCFWPVVFVFFYFDSDGGF